MFRSFHVLETIDKFEMITHIFPQYDTRIKKRIEAPIDKKQINELFRFLSLLLRCVAET